MSNETTGAILIVGGIAALIMAVKGTWDDVFHALVPSSKPGAHKGSAALASFSPGGVLGGGGTSGGSGRPGASPAPLVPGNGGYSALIRGGRFAGVDQGIDFTGPGQVLALGEGVVTRVVRGGSGWPGEGALVNYRLTAGPGAGRYVYVAEDFRADPTLHAGSVLHVGQVLGTATGSGRAPGIEVGWADPSGSPIAPLNPNPHGPKAAGLDFQKFVQSLSSLFQQSGQGLYA